MVRWIQFALSFVFRYSIRIWASGAMATGLPERAPSLDGCPTSLRNPFGEKKNPYFNKEQRADVDGHILRLETPLITISQCEDQKKGVGEKSQQVDGGDDA
jgi:hypothetical protein